MKIELELNVDQASKLHITNYVNKTKTSNTG